VLLCVDVVVFVLRCLFVCLLFVFLCCCSYVSFLTTSSTDKCGSTGWRCHKNQDLSKVAWLPMVHIFRACCGRIAPQGSGPGEPRPVEVIGPPNMGHPSSNPNVQPPKTRFGVSPCKNTAKQKNNTTQTHIHHMYLFFVQKKNKANTW
jgi:hypothetical protein